MKGIIFDVDGTLWDSTREVAVAWNKVLQDEMEGHEILTAEGLQKEFGKPMDAIAESLFPEMSEKDRMELLGKMMAYENELVAVGPCVIYNGVSETIKALSKKYPLYIVSNCQDGYIEAFLKNSGLGGYFKDFTCPAYTGRLKGENIRIIMERNGLDEAGIKEIRQLIEQEKERGALILLASHNQDDMKILADQVYKIADGRIERKGTEL